jgi:hypothetical protein
MMKRSVFVLSILFIAGGNLSANNQVSGISQEVDNEPGVIDHIVISPEEVVLEKGSGQQFTAHAYDADGNQVEFNLVWATTGGTITQDGFYTASQGGCHQVFAIDHDSGLTAEAAVVVTCGEEGETCLAVIPGRVHIHVGDQVQFEVFEKSAEGVGEPVSCGWFSSGGAITEDGLFTADKLGSYTVTAVELDTGRMGSAHVVVEERTPVLPWWAYTMIGGEWFWVMGVLVGLVAGLVAYMFRRSRAAEDA